MNALRRINVASGRQLESIAHYSRAVRVGDTVLQSGTTAIDRQGNVHGEGDIGAQIDAIMRIAAWSMGKAGSRLEDVVRARVYVTDVTVADQAGRALGRHFKDTRPASTLVQVNGLARPTQLVEIELDAVDGAAGSARRISSGRPLEALYGYSRAVRVGDRVFISGSTSLNARGEVEAPGDMYRQTRATMDTILRALAEAGGEPGDIVYTKTFLTDLGGSADYTRAFVEALGDVRPVSTLLGVPGLVHPAMLIEIEAEAVLGAARTRREIYTEHQREKPRGRGRRRHLGQRLHLDLVEGRDAGARRLGGAGGPGAGHDPLDAGSGRRDDGRRRPAAHLHGAGRPAEPGSRPGPDALRQESSRLARLPHRRARAAGARGGGGGRRRQGRRRRHRVDRPRRRRSARRALGRLRVEGRRR
jgi:enamine deaminase RidA (YjgF/YER057c/UK114 family)